MVGDLLVVLWIYDVYLDYDVIGWVVLVVVVFCVVNVL